MPERRIPFDRAAGYYDATRGGDERGRRQAEALRPWLPDAGRVLEIGVGTGVIARAFADVGHDVVGVDLSVAMLVHARDRLAGRVAAGDAMRLPVRDASVGAAVLVHVVQLLPDIPAAIGEAARVLVPGGRLLVVCAPTRPPEDPAVRRVAELRAELGWGRAVEADDVTRGADGAGLVQVHRGELQQSVEATTADLADHLERRIYAWTWDIDDGTWAERVQPVIAELRARPDADDRRAMTDVRTLLVFQAPPQD